MVATLRNVALALMSASLTLPIWADQAHAHDSAMPSHPEQIETIAMGAVSLWLEARFSAAELAGLRAGDVNVESHYCGCYDRPKPHFPYPVVLFKTPKGDLVARPDSREGALSLTPLAVRYGDRYCKLESEQDCYGSFPDPCEFTDFRFGPHLEPFFPTCKEQ